MAVKAEILETEKGNFAQCLGVLYSRQVGFMSFN